MNTKIHSLDPLLTACVEDALAVPDVTVVVPPMVLVRSDRELVRLYNAFLHLSIKSDDTRSTYRSAITLFFRFCDDLALQEIIDIEPEHVRAYLDHRTKTLQMVASAPNHYHAIKSLFQYLVDSGPLTSNPAASVNYAFVRSRKGKTAVITKSDVRALLVSIPSVNGGVKTYQTAA